MTFKHIYRIMGAAVAALTGLTACGGKENTYQEADGMIWNTTYHIVWQGPEELRDSIMPELQKVGASLNVFDESSLVATVNKSAGPVAVDHYFERVYEMSRKIHKESGGAFDPTLSPLITAWGFGPGHTTTGDTLRLDSLLAITGIGKTRLEGGKIYKEDRRIVFNFSAIAKGYGCDCVAEMFKRNGVENYMVEIGGEIASAGINSRGTDWQVQVDRPIRSEGIVHEAQAVIRLSGRGLATSGNYRNFHGEGSGAYGHTISATTGRPVQTDVLSASVVAPDAMEADGLATACMALGSKEALRMCERLKCPVMLVLGDTVIMNEGFKQLIVE